MPFSNKVLETFWEVDHDGHFMTTENYLPHPCHDTVPRFLVNNTTWWSSMTSISSNHSARRRFLSKSLPWVTATICFVVFLYSYGKWIVVSSNKVFDASSFKDLDDSPGKYNTIAGSSDTLSFHNTTRNNKSRDLPILRRNETNTNNGQTSDTSVAKPDHTDKSLRFYILSSPDTTKLLKPVFNQTKSELLDLASNYYRNALNEESAEIWLHRGFQRLPERTKKKMEADVYVVVGYFHLFHALLPSSSSWADDMIPKLYRNIIVDPSKPHLILVPTWNPEISRKIGLHSLVSTLQIRGIPASNLWSVGFERNSKWQPVPLVSRILPIPYVVERDERKDMAQVSTTIKRKENSVFFAGDSRRHADEWSGCSRSKIIDALTTKLKHDPLATVDLQLLHKTSRMNQSTYQERMQSSEYCLVVCGDTPSSRTLSAAIVEGCIPVRVGSRLRGLCDPPCHSGFGWEVTGADYPHLPFAEKIPWDNFPEIDEASLLKSNDTAIAKNSTGILQSMFQHEILETQQLHGAMDRVQSGFIYGYGDPVVSKDFGDAASYIWESFVAALQEKEEGKN